ncbi:MAG: alpha/beta fold hydrolase, partial [Streptosporangiales bacterium]
EFLEVEGGRIAYEVVGEGPLVVLAHGMGDNRNAYRFLVPVLTAAGYRVANTDLRGQGESSTGWSSYTRADTAADLLALIRQLGGPAVIVGHSFSGGSATIAAAQAPELVSAIVEIDAFTRVPKISYGAFLTNRRYRRGGLRLIATALTGRVGAWTSYLDVAFPGTKPADYAEAIASLRANLREPGRMAVAQQMGKSRPTDAEAKLASIRCPALVIMGTLDSDWADPRAEADAIVAAMPAGLGRAVMIDGAGHYPHTQFPDQVAAALLPFLKEHASA